MKQREDIRRWLGHDTQGRLIFDERPFGYYNVAPSKPVTGKIYAESYPDSTETMYSGTFTITFDADDPFGYMLYTSYDDYDVDLATNYGNILATSMMPAAPQANDRLFLIYNPGDEKCGVTLHLSGSAPNGMILRNTLNGTSCELKELPENGVLTIDTESGLITNQYAGLTEYAFGCHNRGLISLDPCNIIRNEVTVVYTSGSNVIELPDLPSWIDPLGKYVWINRKWYRIASLNTDGTAVISASADASGIDVTKIVTMNQIQVEGDGVALTELSYEFTPRLL